MINEAVRMQAKAYADAILGVNAQLAALQRDGAVTAAFRRASVAYQSDATGQYNQVGVDVLRNAHYINGVLQPPLVEPLGVNLDQQSSAVTTAPWTKAPGLTAAPATSCIAGQVAQQLTNTNLGSQATIQSNLGVFVAGQTDLAWCIVEPVTALAVTMGIRDITLSAWVALFQYTYSTQAMVLSAGAGSAGVIPLGFGRYLFWVRTSNGTAGNTRGHFIYPVSTAANTLSAIIHHGQFEPNVGAAGLPSSPIVTGAATGSRAADIDQMFAATATGYSRQIGSFISENFSVGMQVTPANFTDNVPRLITKVTDGTLDVAGPAAPDPAVAGRTLTAIDPLPPNIVSIKNQVDHNIEVREADDENQYPLIVVCVHSDITGPAQVWSGVQDFEGDIHSVLVMRGGSDAVKFRNTDYYLRAMKKATHQFLLSSNTRDTNGTRNGVVIKNGKKTTFGHANGSFMGGQVAGVLKITYCIRDMAA